MAKLRAMKKGKGMSGEMGDGLFQTLRKVGISRGKIEKGIKKE